MKEERGNESFKRREISIQDRLSFIPLPADWTTDTMLSIKSCAVMAQSCVQAI